MCLQLVLAALAIGLTLAGDYDVSEGVQVDNPDAGTCQDCTCLEATCYCKAAGCGAPTAASR